MTKAAYFVAYEDGQWTVRANHEVLHGIVGGSGLVGVYKNQQAAWAAVAYFNRRFSEVASR